MCLCDIAADIPQPLRLQAECDVCHHVTTCYQHGHKTVCESCFNADGEHE